MNIHPDDPDIDYDAVARNAAAVLASARARLRAGAWKPTWTERVMAANIVAATRPEHIVLGDGDAARLPTLAGLARWAAVIRLAHSLDPGPDHAVESTATLSGVLAAAYPLARHLETRLPSPARHALAPPVGGEQVMAAATALFETGLDSILALLEQLAAPWTYQLDPTEPAPVPDLDPHRTA